MDVMEIRCPSGLVGEIRKYKVGDLSVFTDKKLRKSGADTEAQLASKVWLRTMERGPYAFDGDTPPWTREVLYGDRFYTLIQARILSRGPDYLFRVQCDNGSCEKPFEWQVSLDKLRVQQLPDSSKTALASGNRIETHLPCGDVITWSLLTGQVQSRVRKYIKQHGGAPATILAARIVAINGEGHPREYLKYVQDMDLVDYNALDRDLVEKDCGYDTAIEVECEHCDRSQEVEMTLGRDFFLESRSRWAPSPTEQTEQTEQSDSEDL
jgi:hypothetical protein